ncbi:MAG: phosphoribosyltransferase family protein [Bacteroidota bacterium]
MERTLILNELQIHQKVNRLAFQIYEDNFAETEIILAGIHSGGYKFAKKLETAIKEISSLKVTLVEVSLDKENPMGQEVKISMDKKLLDGKVVLLVDDVLNSGKTLIYSMLPFLELPLKKLRTVVLVNRNHNRYPVRADFSGLSLATTIQEHIFVELDVQQEAVYLG